MELYVHEKNSVLFDIDENEKQKHMNTAESFLKGKLIVLKGLDSINVTDKIDWNYEHTNSANTYKLYLHTLNFIKSLVYAFKKTNDENFQRVARIHLNDWIQANYSNLNDTEKVWYDHTVSSRVQNIVYYQIHVDERYKLDSKMFNELITYHLDFLINPNNYNESNHGIMVDRAIMKVSSLINDENIKEKYLTFAKGRIEKAILRDYSFKHMHLENSPAYHRMVTKWLIDIAALLEKLESPLNKKYLTKLENAEKLNGILINYNGEFPMIGDTAYVKTNIKKRDNDFIDNEAGIAILNNKQTESTLIFNNGFQNNGHKHFDDLSFVLSVRKEQIFVDSGKYNHSSKDPVRKYLISPHAHNTLTVKNKTYKLADKFDIELSTYLNFGKFKYLAGIHKAYNNVEIKRIIVSFGGINTIIIDKARSIDYDEFVQKFIVNHDVKINRLNSRTFSIETPNQHEYKITTHNDNTNIENYYGRKNKAFISEKFGSIIDTNRIEVKQKGKKVLFITSFLEKNSELKIVKADHTAVKVKLDDKLFTIPIF